MKGLGCNKNLGRALCGEISFENKIILCDSCTMELIEKFERAKKEISRIKHGKNMGCCINVCDKILEILNDEM